MDEVDMGEVDKEEVEDVGELGQNCVSSQGVGGQSKTTAVSSWTLGDWAREE